MSAAPEFPAFIKLEYQRDNSARDTFLAEVNGILDTTEKRFNSAFSEIGSVIQRATSSFKRGDFRLDLDMSGLRQASAEADHAYQRLITLRDSAVKLAQATNDTSQKTHDYIQALRAQTTEAANARSAAFEQLQTYGRLQGAVDKLVDRNQALAASYRETYLEQAKAENMAFYSQKAVNAVAAPGLTSRATDNGAGFSALAAMVDEQDRAAQAAARYAQAAANIRSTLDPTIAIQQRFNAAIDQADELLRMGAISEKEYAAEVARARQELQSSWTAMTSAQNAQEQAAKRGTQANHMMVNSFRAQRTAFIQTGQQLQDMAIQFQMGTKASLIFGQQIPQLGFALSGLDSNANKTLAKLGNLGMFMAGPWGAAIVIAIAALAPFIDSLFGAGDAADELKAKNMTLADALDKTRFGTVEAMKALEDYNAEQERARNSTDDMIKLNLAEAEAHLKVALAVREELKAKYELAEISARANAGQGTGGAAGAWTGGQASIAQAALNENAKSIATLNETISNLKIQDATRDAKAAVDPIQAINNKYDDMEAAARRAAAGNKALEGSLKGTLTQMEKNRKAELDAAREANRKGRGSTGQYGREINLQDALSIARGAGFKVTSDFRSYDQQKRLYDQWVAQGKPKDNPVAKPGTGAHESGNALDIAFGPGVTEASLRKAYSEQGVRLTKILKERGHFHIEWSTSGADKARREAEQLAEWGQRTSDSISQINAQFDETPRFVDQAAAATSRLDDIIKDLSERKPIGWEQMVKDAEAAKGTIQEALVRPFEELNQESERRITIQTLLTQGREDEANALEEIWRLEERLGPLDDQRKQAIYEQVRNERLITEELQRRREVIGYYLDATNSIRQNLVGLFSGQSVNFGQIFKQLQAQVMVEKLFGPALHELDNWVKTSGMGDSVDYLSDEKKRAGGAAGDFVDALVDATSKVNGTGYSSTGTLGSAFDSAFGLSGGSPLDLVRQFAGGLSDPGIITGYGGGTFNTSGQATDLLGLFNQYANSMPITVNAAKGASGMRTAVGLTPEAYFAQMTRSVVKPLIDGLTPLLGQKFAGTVGNVLSGAMTGMMTGGTTGGILGALQGIVGTNTKLGTLLGKGMQGAATGTMISGLGNALGIKMSTGGSQIGGALGSIFGPGGSVIGAIAGGLLGSVFHKAKYGNATFTNGAMNVNSNSSDGKSAGETAGSDFMSMLSGLADQLGATLGAFNVSIGQTDGKWRISTTGRSGELKSKYSDVQVFGTGDEAYKQAVEAAVRDAISDGAITGISQAAQNILRSGKDLQKSIEKAILIESIPRRLKELTDPVGAAIDALNKEFQVLVDALKEGGATAQQFADAQKLYDLQRAAAIKQATEQMTGSLRSLYEQLTVGNDALSLRDRQSMALEKYNALAARVRAGDTTAYDDYANAAQTLLDIERQMYGSQAGYFERLDSVTSLLKTTIDAQQAKIDAATASNSPFSNVAVAANDNQAALDALNALGAKADATNDNLGAIIELLKTNGVRYNVGNKAGYF